MNDAATIAKTGGKLPVFARFDRLFENGDAVFLPVDSEESLRGYFGYGLWFNKGFFPAVQIVWGDTANRFPWEAGFEERFRAYQPLLGEMPSDS